MAVALILALLAPGRASESLPSNPKPGDRVTLADFDGAGNPTRFLVALDRETYERIDRNRFDLGMFLEAWGNGEAWHVDSPVRAVLVERPRVVVDDSDDSKPVVLVRLLEGPYEGLTLAVAEEVIVRP